MKPTTLPFAILIGALALTGAERRLDFNRDIRPLLSDKCYLCHGPDASAKGVPVRLDQEAAAKADLGGRRAIVPGDPGASQLVRRITSPDAATRMPPVYSGLKLAEQGSTRFGPGSRKVRSGGATGPSSLPPARCFPK